MKKITWDQFEQLVIELSKKMTQDNYNPDLLIAVARGGWIPTRYLSDSLKVKKIASVGVTYKSDKRTDLDFYSFPEPIKEGANLLLIEDRLETGKSLEFVQAKLSERGANVKTAAFYIRSDTIVTPDFYLGLDDDELIFPWEV